MKHDLKTWPEFFEAMLSGEKTFELRKDDRGFVTGDILLLREWNPATKEYSGRELTRKVTWLLGHRAEAGCAATFGLLPGYVIMGIAGVAQASPDRQVALDSDGKPVYFTQALADRTDLEISDEWERRFGITLDPAECIPAQGWQESAAKWLEARSDLLTNSLHCGDSSMAIHFTHKHATALRSLAKDIRDSTVSSTHQRCAKCGCETKGEAALVDGKIWCHPCADMVPSTPRATPAVCDRCDGSGHEPSCDGACFRCYGSGKDPVAVMTSTHSQTQEK